MEKTCPKCNYTRKPTDYAPEYECPSCGVIYSKFVPGDAAKKAPAAPSASPVSTVTAADSLSQRVKIYLAACLAGGLVIGYFAGREHVKYELRSAFQSAAEGMQRSLSSAFGSADSKTQSKPPPPATPKESSSFKITLLKKGFSNLGVAEDAITFTVVFDNLTGKDIRAFDGILSFTDLLDNKILSAKLAINDPVGPASTLQWEGQLHYNKFIDAHQRLRGAEFENLKVLFTPRKILYTDGTTKEFE